MNSHYKQLTQFYFSGGGGGASIQFHLQFSTIRKFQLNNMMSTISLATSYCSRLCFIGDLNMNMSSASSKLSCQAPLLWKAVQPHRRDFPQKAELELDLFHILK